MPLSFHTLDVFTSQLHGGNPLAVVFGAEALPSGRLQRIAREFNLSETVFVLPPTRPDAAHRLRIFTPTQELPFAGHPTVGAAALLAELGQLAVDGDHAVLEEGVGPIAVTIRREPGAPTYAELTTAVLPQAGPAAPPDAAIAGVLGLEPAAIGHGAERPRQWSCGLPFLLVPLSAPEQLAAIEFDPHRTAALLAGGWARGLYVYARGYEGELRARMFSAALGIGEDPATGSAAAALAGALGSEAGADGLLQWTLHQGVEMGRPSVLQLSVERRGGAVTAVRVGGRVVRVSEGRLLQL